MNYRFETKTQYPIDLVEWSRKRQAEIESEAERQRKNMQQTMTMLGVLGAYGKDWYRKNQGAEARDYYNENWAPYGDDAVTMASLGFNPSMWNIMNPNGVQLPENEPAVVPNTLGNDNSWWMMG